MGSDTRSDLGPASGTSASAAVLVPIKGFDEAKARLAAEVPPARRRALARAMALRVLRAAHALPVFVVCDDREVAEWATEHGAGTIAAGGPGLDRAVEVGLTELAAAGFGRVVVAHADLPLVDDLSALGADEVTGVVVVTDRRNDGTNVLSLPTSVGFRVAYGPGSRARHEAEAGRLGLALTVVDEGPLCWDVDVPDDLSGPAAEVLAVLPDEVARPLPSTDRGSRRTGP